MNMKNGSKIIKIKTNFGYFDCLFESNKPERGYTITAPKLKGVVTCGDTIKEAKAMAKEAVELHCECLLDEGLAELRFLKTPKKAHAVAFAR